MFRQAFGTLHSWCLYDGALVATDECNHNIVCLGGVTRPDMTSDGLRYPAGIYSIGDALCICDSWNQRVLIQRKSDATQSIRPDWHPFVPSIIKWIDARLFILDIHHQRLFQTDLDGRHWRPQELSAQLGHVVDMDGCGEEWFYVGHDALSYIVRGVITRRLAVGTAHQWRIVGVGKRSAFLHDRKDRRLSLWLPRSGTLVDVLSLDNVEIPVFGDDAIMIFDEERGTLSHQSDERWASSIGVMWEGLDVVAREDLRHALGFQPESGLLTHLPCEMQDDALLTHHLAFTTLSYLSRLMAQSDDLFHNSTAALHGLNRLGERPSTIANGLLTIQGRAEFRRGCHLVDQWLYLAQFSEDEQQLRTGLARIRDYLQDLVPYDQEEEPDWLRIGFAVNLIGMLVEGVAGQGVVLGGQYPLAQWLNVGDSLAQIRIQYASAITEYALMEHKVAIYATDPKLETHVIGRIRAGSRLAMFDILGGDLLPEVTIDLTTGCHLLFQWGEKEALKALTTWVASCFDASPLRFGLQGMVDCWLGQTRAAVEGMRALCEVPCDEHHFQYAKTCVIAGRKRVDPFGKTPYPPLFRRLYLGRLALMQGQLEKARTFFERERASRDHWIIDLYVWMLSLLSGDDSALNMSFSERHGQPDRQVFQALTLRLLGDPEAALSLLLAHPDSDRLLYQTGLAYRIAGDLESARRCFERGFDKTGYLRFRFQAALTRRLAGDDWSLIEHDDLDWIFEADSVVHGEDAGLSRAIDRYLSLETKSLKKISLSDRQCVLYSQLWAVPYAVSLHHQCWLAASDFYRCDGYWFLDPR